MNKELLTIESELQCLNENLNAVRKIRHRLQTRVFALNLPEEHYTETISILVDNKATMLSLYNNYFGSEREEMISTIINLSPETKMLHNELKTAYKETADYITELITIAKEKAELAPSENPEDVVSQNFNYRIFTSEKGQFIFDEWHELHKDKKSHADYSFIFRMLENDGFIQFGIGETIFRAFLEDYNIIVGKLNTLNKCNTTKRINLYNKIKIAIR